MFHAGKSLVFSKGYSEKSHECVIIAVEEFFVLTGTLPMTVVDHIRDAKSAREAADYGLTYGNDAATMIIREADEVFLIISEYHAESGIPPFEL